jgi:hypothetical protein
VQPFLEEKSLVEAVAGKQTISRIGTAFSVTFEKADSEMKGEGVLDLFKNGDLDLKVYSLGFLALELVSRDGIVKSNPGLDSSKKRILSQGLRDSLFWWDIKDFTTLDEGDFYLLRSDGREITVDKKSMLPVKQQIFLPDGKMLSVYYENPANEDNFRYQSKIKIELARYSVTLNIRNISINR